MTIAKISRETGMHYNTVRNLLAKYYEKEDTWDIVRSANEEMILQSQYIINLFLKGLQKEECMLTLDDVNTVSRIAERAFRQNRMLESGEWGISRGFMRLH